MHFSRTILLIALCSAIPLLSFSAHIIGGEITYDCEGSQREGFQLYTIQMKIYRDCQGGGAGFDSTDGALEGTVSIYGGADAEPIIVILGRPSVKRVRPPDNPCIKLPDNVCVEQGFYNFQIELPIISESYYIVYQRCCRNRTISNIFTPGETGATYVGEITALAQETCNNSPKFENFPPIALCLGEEFSFSQEARDKEGDSLVYEFCTPFIGGGTNTEDLEAIDGVAPNPDAPPPYDQVGFVDRAYDSDNPLGFNANLKINRQTGRITGKPRIWGQFVAGVCVSEYRDGELLSVVRRDFQINVTPCLASVIPHINNADSIVFQDEFYLWSCRGETEIEFDNKSFSRISIDSTIWEFEIDGDTLRSFDWDLTIDFPAPGEYRGRLMVNPGGQCGDTSQIIVEIQDDIQPDFTIASDTCEATDVEFQDLTMSAGATADRWTWYFGDGDSSNVQNPAHFYEQAGEFLVTLDVGIRHCDTTISKPFRYFPAPNSIEITPQAITECGESEITFNHFSSPINNDYSTIWRFGDGDSSMLKNPSHTYDSVGNYDVELEITSPIGCVASRLFEDWVRIVPPLEADFSFTYNSCNAEPVNFVDLSQANGNPPDSWEWLFGDGESSDLQNPTHLFQRAGEQTITLNVALGECEGSLTKTLLYYPVPQEVTIAQNGGIFCGATTINFENLSIPIVDENYGVTWDFGDGGRSNELSPSYNYSEIGIFPVSLEISSPSGCINSATFENFVQIDPQPIANFSFIPQQPTFNNPTVNFIDSSQFASTYEWIFNQGEAFSSLNNPTYTFPDTGFQEITLIVTHESGCQDSITQQLDIPPIVKFFIPNAFSPNDDGRNDEFLPQGIVLGIRDYELSIWNRWGNLVFQTNDPFQAWDGKIDNLRTEGTQAGTYVYHISYKDARGNPFEFAGSVLVVR
ncbi:MAG: PKD domain-containing protein [Bacteroidota bacterium]